jgi:transcriptional regulator with XRE-family HTH domain
VRKRSVAGGSALLRLGERVRNLRRAANLTQEELAEKCDLHPNYVGYIERAERAVNVVVLFQIAAALGVEPSALLEGIRLRDVRTLPPRK